MPLEFYRTYSKRAETYAKRNFCLSEMPFAIVNREFRVTSNRFAWPTLMFSRKVLICTITGLTKSNKVSILQKCKGGFSSATYGMFLRCTYCRESVFRIDPQNVSAKKGRRLEAEDSFALTMVQNCTKFCASNLSGMALPASQLLLSHIQ